MHANNTTSIDIKVLTDLCRNGDFSTTDAVEIMHRLFVKGDPEEIALLEKERVKLEIAQHIYDLRTSGGQTQEEFGELVGVSPHFAIAYYARGVAKEAAALFEEAIADFKQDFQD